MARSMMLGGPGSHDPAMREAGVNTLISTFALDPEAVRYAEQRNNEIFGRENDGKK